MCVEQRISREGGNHAKLLPVFIDELLQGANERGERIEAVALSEGPGSYTGLRIGTSTAKGLCYGLNVPLIPVPTLDVLCAAACEQLTNDLTVSPSSGETLDGRGNNSQLLTTNNQLIPMIDARRMEVYTTVKVRGGLMNDANDANDGRARAVVVENEENLLTNDLTVSPSSGETLDGRGNNDPIYYFGDGAAKCQSVLTGPRWHYIPDIVPEARFVGLLAEQSQITNHKSQIKNQKSKITNQDLAYYEPSYLQEFIAAPSHVKGLS